LKAKPSKHPGEVLLELNPRDEPLLEHVIRHAQCPVLVVREHEHEFLAA